MAALFPTTTFRRYAFDHFLPFALRTGTHDLEYWREDAFCVARWHMLPEPRLVYGNFGGLDMTTQLELSLLTLLGVVVTEMPKVVRL